jgi:hypothetical protein
MKPHMYFLNNWKTPNLILTLGPTSVDLTATFANIELHYGSKTEPSSEKEAFRRRALKENLKLQVLEYLMNFQDESEEAEAKYHLRIWVIPHLSFNYDAELTTAFTILDEADELDKVEAETRLTDG